MPAPRATKYGLFILLFLTSAVIASVQEPRPSYGPAIRLEVAKRILAGAIEAARKNNWNVAVALVDNHGFLICFERRDDTQTACARIAIEKAGSEHEDAC